MKIYYSPLNWYIIVFANRVRYTSNHILMYRERRDMPLGLVQPLSGIVSRGDPAHVQHMQQMQQMQNLQERAERERNIHNVNVDPAMMGGDVRNAYGGGSNVNMSK